MAELIDKRQLENYLTDWKKGLSQNPVESYSYAIAAKATAGALDRMLDHINHMPVESQQPSWHPASEIPPLTRRSWRDGGETFTFLESAPLLLMLSDGDMKTGWFNRSGTGDVWMDDCGQTYNHRITHWMERPKPPKEAAP